MINKVYKCWIYWNLAACKWDFAIVEWSIKIFQKLLNKDSDSFEILDVNINYKGKNGSWWNSRKIFLLKWPKKR